MELVIQKYFLPHWRENAIAPRLEALKDAVATAWNKTCPVENRATYGDVTFSDAVYSDCIVLTVDSGLTSQFDLDHVTMNTITADIASAIDAVLATDLVYCMYCGRPMGANETHNLMMVDENGIIAKQRSFCNTCRPIIETELIRLTAGKDIKQILNDGFKPIIEKEIK